MCIHSLPLNEIMHYALGFMEMNHENLHFEDLKVALPLCGLSYAGKIVPMVQQLLPVVKLLLSARVSLERAKMFSAPCAEQRFVTH